ncbi:Uncharacterised protein [Klebsiella pneumoniae]|nr:Uncharacterised protein [Klebsiella pneumoniae]
MLCASTQATITSNTGRTPGVRSTPSRRRRRPAGWPGKSGTLRSTQPTSSSAVSDNRPKAQRQPSRPPSQVPSGTPSDSASGAPSMATASARPCCSGGTRRRA